MDQDWVRFTFNLLLAFLKFQGFYEPFRRNLNSLFGWSPNEQIPFTSVAAGAISGAVGGSFAHSDFFFFPNQPFSVSVSRQSLVPDQSKNAGRAQIHKLVFPCFSPCSRLTLPHSRSARSIITEVHLMHCPPSSARSDLEGSSAAWTLPSSEHLWAHLFVSWLAVLYLSLMLFRCNFQATILQKSFWWTTISSLLTVHGLFLPAAASPEYALYVNLVQCIRNPFSNPNLSA
jgi:hypothetical protein